MEGRMITTLIIGAIKAIAFNVWNKKNPVGGGRGGAKRTQQQYQQQMTKEEWRNQEVYQMAFDNIPPQYRYKGDKDKENPSGALHDSDGKRIK
jgi:hypothetical protein